MLIKILKFIVILPIALCSTIAVGASLDTWFSTLKPGRFTGEASVTPGYPSKVKSPENFFLVLDDLGNKENEGLTIITDPSMPTNLNVLKVEYYNDPEYPYQFSFLMKDPNNGKYLGVPVQNPKSTEFYYTSDFYDAAVFTMTYGEPRLLESNSGIRLDNLVVSRMAKLIDPQNPGLLHSILFYKKVKDTDGGLNSGAAVLTTKPQGAELLGNLLTLTKIVGVSRITWQDFDQIYVWKKQLRYHGNDSGPSSIKYWHAFSLAAGAGDPALYWYASDKQNSDNYARCYAYGGDHDVIHCDKEKVVEQSRYQFKFETDSRVVQGPNNGLYRYAIKNNGTNKWIALRDKCSPDCLSANGGSRKDARLFVPNGVRKISHYPDEKAYKPESRSSSGIFMLRMSDERLKTDVTDIPDVERAFEELNVKKYKYKNTGDIGYGVMAQDVEKIYPEMVFNTESGYKQVDYTGLIAVMWRKMQLMEVELKQLKSK